MEKMLKMKIVSLHFKSGAKEFNASGFILLNTSGLGNESVCFLIKANKVILNRFET